jgi:leucyl aminopeptidase
MQIRVEGSDCTEFETPLLAVNIFAGETELVGPVAKVDERLGGRITDVITRGDFRGKEGQTLLIYPSDGQIPAERVLLVGLGKREKLDLERIRRAAATATRQAAKLGVTRFATIMHHAELVSERIGAGDAARAAVEGMLLADYRFDELKSAPAPEDVLPRVEEVVILEKVEEKAAAIREASRVGGALARGELLARRLGNLPGNVATPSYLGETAEKIGRDYGMQVLVMGPVELQAEGMHALLAVSRGSDEEPRFIVMEHRKGPADQKPLVLVGKGLTFDAGGISIKPSQGLEDMKFDMCGAAAVLGAMQAIGELGIEANVIALVPSSENLLSGSAVKPGDVIQSHLGKSIEIINTDAEGRLILADALSYARRFEPAAVVDAATLTGACVIALGHTASAALGNDEALIEELRAAGDRVGQRVWQLPMFDEYRDLIKSDYADIKNSGGRPAGTISAAWFLREFVGDFPWVHFDIAGTAYGDGKLPYQSKGATGAPARTFVEWVIARAG